eukprot:Nk52_evm8s1178 gene=Nk52_evmTU8s1178
MGRNAKRKVAGEQSQEQRKKKKRSTEEQPKVFRPDKKLNKWIKWAEKSVEESSKSIHSVRGDSRLLRYSLAIGMKLALDSKSGCDGGRLSVFEVLVKYLLDYKLKLKGPLKEMVEVLRLCEKSIAEGKTDKEINELIKQAHYESYNNGSVLNVTLDEMAEKHFAERVNETMATGECTDVGLTNMTSELAERLQLVSAEGIEEEGEEGEESEDNEEQYLLGDEDELDSQNQEGHQDDEEQYPSIYQNEEGQKDGTVTEEHEQSRDSTRKSKSQLNEALQGSDFKTPRMHMMKSTKNMGRRMSMSERRKNSAYLNRVRH